MFLFQIYGSLTIERAPQIQNVPCCVWNKELNIGLHVCIYNQTLISLTDGWKG